MANVHKTGRLCDKCEGLAGVIFGEVMGRRRGISYRCDSMRVAWGAICMVIKILGLEMGVFVLVDLGVEGCGWRRRFMMDGGMEIITCQ